MSTDSKHSVGRKVLLAAVAVIVLALLVVWVMWPQPGWVQGQIEVTQVRASAKLSARVVSVDVQEGDWVDAGQVVAQVSAPELDARAIQAEAAVAAAQAQADKSHAGARDEEIGAARAQWEAAQAQAELAELTQNRMNNLYEDGVIPAQQRDEARALAAGARAQAQAARQQLDMAESGARTEDQRAADAMLAQARGGRAEVQSFQDEVRVFAPAAGEVVRKVFEPGEIAPAGAPVVLIARTDDPWLVLNLREDMLANIRIGSELQGRIPALGNENIRFIVDYIAPMADFATWRSTRDLGGFDLRTFEVRARPAQTVEGLRPGMSVLVAERDLASGVVR